MPRTRWAATMLAGYLLLAGAVLSFLWAPAVFAGALTNKTALVTDPSPSASTTYQFTFVTATTGTIKYINFDFPTGYGSSAVSLGLTSGIGAGTIASTSSSQDACYTVTSPASVNSGTTISVQMSGITNPSTTGSKTLTVNTRSSSASSCTSGGAIDNGGFTVTINNANSISATAQQVFVFTVSAGSVSMSVNPASSPTTTATLDLTVATNTSSGTGGYRVSAKTSQTLTGTAYNTSTILPWTGTASSPTSWNTGTNPNYWGVTRTGFINDSGSYFGLTTSAQTVMNGNGPTNGDTTTLTFKVAVDYNTPADSYTSVITLVGTPSF